MHRIDLKDFIGEVTIFGGEKLSIGSDNDGADAVPFFMRKFDPRVCPRYLFADRPFTIRGHKTDDAPYDSEPVTVKVKITSTEPPAPEFFGDE